jgi:hypothetical protein
MFTTPSLLESADYQHAKFYLFTREQTDGEFSNCPAGVAVDAVRLQTVALTKDQVIENHDDITSGRGANPSAVMRPIFHRGDPNGDGNINITDGIYVLNFLFLGGPEPPAPYAACGRSSVGSDMTLGCADTSACE